MRAGRVCNSLRGSGKKNVVVRKPEKPLPRELSTRLAGERVGRLDRQGDGRLKLSGVVQPGQGLQGVQRRLQELGGTDCVMRVGGTEGGSTFGPRVTTHGEPLS